MTVLGDLLAQPAFALIRARDGDVVTALGGRRIDVKTLAEIDMTPGSGRHWDRLVVVPFAQATERGLQAHQDGVPLTVIEGDLSTEIALGALLDELPDEPIEFTDPGGFDTSDAEYAETVRRVIAAEVGQGEGANVVIARNYRAQVADWDFRKALTIFRRLLERERGSFWTFCIFTGDRYLIGASPERHVSVDAGQVRMNPISGTFRLRGLDTYAERKVALLDFLRDEKEIYELFMVVDEELKMMCDICHEGGQVLGPYLKPMTHLMHTEYLLAGRTERDVRDVLRDSMFAATVTGSPVENACRVIKRYESTGRGYYASIAALLGHDEDGAQRAEAPILIRTADVDLAGKVTVTAGATLVRDSDPQSETAETWAKASGILAAFGLVEPATAPAGDLTALIREDEVLLALADRNQRLSQFWLNDQSGASEVESLRGKRVLLLDGEDAFVNMLTHVLSVLGMVTETVRHTDYDPRLARAYDLVVVGPGPGDPRDGTDPKMVAWRSAVDHLLAEQQPFLAVCLGHQALAHSLGLDLEFKDIVFQGTQQRLPVMGRSETVGFYNTFVARVPDAGLPAGVSVETDPKTGDVHLLYGPHYRGVQFHAESILTQNGFAILRDLVTELIGL